jgi:ParB family chromosome partitioning protein
MDLEHHQLELRYESLRVRRAEKERRLVASLAANGQQVPIVVVAGGSTGRHIVIDGYKRVRALKRLGHDIVLAIEWSMNEAEALLLSRSLRSAEAESALEQGWLLKELHTSFGMSQEELARRFDRSLSWVSRRLALACELPASVQGHVQSGRIGAHAAMKHLVPMARAKPKDCERLAAVIAPLRLSTREVGDLYRAWRDGGRKLRERLLAEPGLFVKARREMEQAPPAPTAETLLEDLDLVGVLARRVRRRYRECAGDMDTDERDSIQRCLTQAINDLERLAVAVGHAVEEKATEEIDDEALRTHTVFEEPIDKEERTRADPRAESRDPGASPPGSGVPTDSQGLEDLSQQRQGRDPAGLEPGPGGPPRGEGRTLSGRDTEAVPLVQGKLAASA